MEDNERGQEVKQAADDMYYWCACVAGKPLPLLFSSLLLSSTLISSHLISSLLFSSLYLSLPLLSSEYLRFPSRPPFAWKHSCESSTVSDTFRQESQPSSPSLDISREYAHACTLNKILPSFYEKETQRSVFLLNTWVSARYLCEKNAYQIFFLYFCNFKEFLR